VAGALIMEVSLDGLPLAEAGKLAWARVQAWGRTHGEANLATLLARFASDRRGALDPAGLCAALAALKVPLKSRPVLRGSCLPLVCLPPPPPCTCARNQTQRCARNQARSQCLALRAESKHAMRAESKPRAARGIKVRVARGVQTCAAGKQKLRTARGLLLCSFAPCVPLAQPCCSSTETVDSKHYWMPGETVDMWRSCSCDILRPQT
jgi:hypothetical protein